MTTYLGTYLTYLGSINIKIYHWNMIIMSNLLLLVIIQLFSRWTHYDFSPPPPPPPVIAVIPQPEIEEECK